MSNVVEYGARRAAVVTAVMLAALMQLADTTIVNVALPTIDGSLGATTDQGAWFVTAYIIANVIVIPLSPWFITLLGRRNYFALSIAGFTVVSVLCGLANDTTTEIALRFIQGAFGGGLMVPAQQIIRDTFPPNLLGKSQSLFALAVVIGPTIGPTLGGLLTDQGSWRWVFFINVLPGIAATILVMLFVRDPERPRRMSFDFFGVGLLAVGLGALQYVLDEGERDGWFSDSNIVMLAALSLLALLAFTFWELYGAKNPGVALRVFGQRSVWALAVINFAVGGAIFGLVFIQPQYTQESLGFTTTLAGMLLMVRAGTIAILYPITTWVVSQPRIDLRAVAAAGIFVAGLATWLQTYQMTTNSSFLTFVLTQMLSGVGFAFVFVPLNVVLFKAVVPSTIPAALALTRLAQQIGASVGSAYAATLLDRGFAIAQNALAGSVSLGRASVQQFLATHGPHALGTLEGLVAAQAANISAAQATKFFALATMCATALPFLLARSREHPKALAVPPLRTERGAIDTPRKPVGATR